MLDRVPLGCARRVVGDGHAETVALSELLLQAMLPRTTPGPVAAAAVRQDREFPGVGVSLSGVVDPPSLDGVDGEGGRGSRGPDVDVRRFFPLGIWGYHPLVVSLANTGEPLFLKNRSGNRPSHEGVIPYFDKAIALCRRAGFRDILLRGDTDFALTTAFDRWTDAGVRFVFGYDATRTMVQWGQTAPPELYTALVRRTKRALPRRPRQRPARVKDRIVRERGFRKITTVREEVVGITGGCRAVRSAPFLRASGRGSDVILLL